mmetsp:Transcript_121616/g.339405  ORF Transcript_121616/g.339405 Transcript_121616/m.339405 type:complete len:112 (-) Transcript_121616:60-395(-)
MLSVEVIVGIVAGVAVTCLLVGLFVAPTMWHRRPPPGPAQSEGSVHTGKREYAPEVDDTPRVEFNRIIREVNGAPNGNSTAMVIDLRDISTVTDDHKVEGSAPRTGCCCGG